MVQDERPALSVRVQRLLMTMLSLGYVCASRAATIERERECYRTCCDPQRAERATADIQRSSRDHFWCSDVDCWLLHRVWRVPICVQLLGSFVEAAAARSPLTLQELGRNAVRVTVGGTHFAARVRALQLPAALLDFIILTASVSLHS